jgi:hypothetical protein
MRRNTQNEEAYTNIIICTGEEIESYGWKNPDDSWFNTEGEEDREMYTLSTLLRRKRPWREEGERPPPLPDACPTKRKANKRTNGEVGGKEKNL